MIYKFFTPVVLLSIFSASAIAQWNPSDGWEDSYAVDGQCYCNSSNYDHNLDEKTADTPIGTLNVVQICNDLKEVLGEGSTEGRIAYNDIQCGNGPANDAPDETGCPGRVDNGSAGCDEIGPTWNLDLVYGDALDRDDWVFITSRNNRAAFRMNDGKDSSRWNTRQAQRFGQWVEIDLASKKRFDQIVLDTSANPNDYPREYQVKVSNTGEYWREAATGEGSGPITVINFDREYARYIRIKQTGDANNWWSIHEINVRR